MKQGTRPSKKTTNIKDVKRYLSVASFARDGMLVVRRNDPLVPSTELIIVPRSVLHGLVTALHIKLGHRSRHQLELDQFRQIIVRYKRIGYSINIMRQSACLVFNPITVNNFASLFNCTPVGRASDSMMAPT